MPPKSKEKPKIEQPIKPKSPQKVAPVEEQKSLSLPKSDVPKVEESKAENVSQNPTGSMNSKQPSEDIKKEAPKIVNPFLKFNNDGAASNAFLSLGSNQNVKPNPQPAGNPPSNMFAAPPMNAPSTSVNPFLTPTMAANANTTRSNPFLRANLPGASQVGTNSTFGPAATSSSTTTNITNPFVFAPNQTSLNPQQQ